MSPNTSADCSSHCQALAGSGLGQVFVSGETDKALLLKLCALVEFNCNFTGIDALGLQNFFVLEKLASLC